jgi:hypothetical protein
MNGILAGVTVALKQSVPETELKLLMLSIKVKVRFSRGAGFGVVAQEMLTLEMFNFL